MHIKKKIILVSYYGGIDGSCQSEWLDDKIDAINHLDYKIILITSTACKKNHFIKKNDHLKIHKLIRIPSLSAIDNLHEFELNKETNNFFLNFSRLLLGFLGMPFDLVIYLITLGKGEGRWLWSITSFIQILLQKKDDDTLIVSTGGPASAHIAAIIAKILSFKSLKLITELQDPLSGEKIGRNIFSSLYLIMVEIFILKFSDKIIYVTKEAAFKASHKFKKFKNKIFGIYPGSRLFIQNQSLVFNKTEKKITFIHLGSLYSTRNFDILVKAINCDDQISKMIINKEIKFKIVNLGHVAPEIRNRIKKINYIKIFKPRNRIKALNIAKMYDYLLLIQNNDSRSKLTIPYKTYDYLNLNKPIFSLIQNNELKNILKVNGHLTASTSDQTEVNQNLRNIFLNKYEFLGNKTTFQNTKFIKEFIDA